MLRTPSTWLWVAWWEILIANTCSAQSIFTSLHNIEEANPTIQQAARAVVKLETADGSTGSAAFISSRGHLLTNNHLLGVDCRNCAREGCYVRLSLGYQAGRMALTSVEVFAEPLYVRTDLDATVYQIWRDGARTQRFIPPHFLRIRAVTALQLRGERVVLIGHPLGFLKKWTSGTVFRDQGHWFLATNPSLPGQSGGPYVDGNGFLVGLHHSYFGHQERSTRADSNLYAGGTAGSALAEMLRQPPDNRAFFSLRQPHAEQEVLLHQNAYLMARQTKAVMASGTAPLLDLLALRCDRALEANTFESPDHFHAEMGWCTASLNWMGCGATGSTRICPQGPDKEIWLERYSRLAKKAQEFSSDLFLSYLVSASVLEKDAASERRVKQAKLRAYLQDSRPPMSFELAFFLLDAGMGREHYAGARAVDWILHYQRDLQYRYQFEWIVGSLEPLYADRLITLPQLMRLVQTILADPHLSVSDMLFLEAFLQRNGFPLSAGRTDVN